MAAATAGRPQIDLAFLHHEGPSPFTSVVASQPEPNNRSEKREGLDHNDMIHNQLDDHTNLVTERQDETVGIYEHLDERLGAREVRGKDKDVQDAPSRDRLEQIFANQLDMKNANAVSRDELMAEMQSHHLQALNSIEQQRIVSEGVIREMAGAWRADHEKQKTEIIAAVKATANEQVPFNVQGYLDELSRSLATEIRMLLREVGELREEKRNLELWAFVFRSPHYDMRVLNDISFQPDRRVPHFQG
uniref:N/A n=1 Tax=Ganoderma boninense TaxID=34458 RepID=A0A5K1K864_9APHY|nr:N/A [Ganoderma boninense]